MTELQVVKRDGRIVPFDTSRIIRAVERCYAECDPSRLTRYKPELIAREIEATIGAYAASQDAPASVETIQDLVEEQLMLHDEPEAAKRYILYRAEHARQREG